MSATTVPRTVGVHLAHAAVQSLAEDHGLDLLHIKGPAVDATLLQVRSSDEAASTGEQSGPVPRAGGDADVLVRPDHVDRLIEVMHRHRWTTAYQFEDGSAFHHAQTLVHPFLAPVDLHRRFPGIDLHPALAFETLWADRHEAVIAGRPCAVPSVTAQRLILILHAARGGAAGHPDIRRCWAEATDEQRQAVLHLADLVGARLALAAGTGGLDDHAGAPGHDLWLALSTGEGSLSRLWWARVKAAPTRQAALRTAVRLVVPTTRRLHVTLGRPPTAREVLRAHLRRAGLAAREARRLLRDRA